MTARIIPLRRSFVVLALILAGALMVSAVPSAGLAQDDEPFQNVERFEPVSLSNDMMLELQSTVDEMDSMTLLMVYMQLQDLGEFDTDITRDHIQEVESIDSVNEHLGSDLSVPGELPGDLGSDDAFYATGEAGQASFTFDVEVAHRISRLLELPTDWLPDPEEQSEATVSVNIPKSGMAGWKSGHDFLVAGQIGVPELDLPEDLDLERLREALLDDPRMPDELADQLGAISDWESTVPVPVPEGAEYEDVTVDGNPGFQLSMDGHSVIAWIGDDTLHFVAGSFDAEEIEDTADSLSRTVAGRTGTEPLAFNLMLRQ